MTAQPLSPLLFSFRWPSVAYALDILAWDIFFALAGLFGVMLEDMQVRNIGIVGYGVVFPVGVLLLAVLLFRTTPRAPVP